MYFPLLLDIETLSEYLLDSIDVRIRLELNSDKWVINSDLDTGVYKYGIKPARLWIDKVTLYPAGLTALNRILLQNNAPVSYTFDKILSKMYILGEGQSSITMDGPWGALIPEKHIFLHY